MGGTKKTFVFFFIVRHASTQPKSQHPEAWPASTYGHLREVPESKKLLSGTLLDNNLILNILHVGNYAQNLKRL